MKLFNILRKNKSPTKTISLGDYMSWYRSYYEYNLDTAKFLKQVDKNPFTSSALNRITQALNNLTWSTYKKGRGDNVNEVIGSYVNNSLQRPSKLTNIDQFVSYFAMYYIVYGELLVQRIDYITRSELIIYKQGTYRIEYDENILNGLKSIKIGGKTYAGNELNNFHYIKNVNIHDNIAGLGVGNSNIVSLAMIHDYYCLINNWNNSVLKRGSRRSFALLFNNFIGPHKKEEIESAIEEVSGASNVFKPLILEGAGATLVPTDFNPKDFDFMNALDEIRNITATVMNVPSILIGDRTNQKFSNYREAKKDLYTETVIPLAEQISGHLNVMFVDKFEGKEYIDYDTSKVEVLKEDKKEMMNTLNNIGFLSINEKRAELEYPAVEGGDEILINGIATPLSQISEDVTPAGEEEPDAEVLNE